MTRTRILLTAVALAALVAVGTASAATPRPLNVVSLNNPTIGGHLFLGRTPLQITSAFGKPSARTATTLHYGHWTISFQKRSSDGKLLAYAARRTGGTLTGLFGHTLLTPSYSRAQIAAGVTAELGWSTDNELNSWIPRGTSSYVSADFPRTISWGIDRHGVRWLKIQTDLNVEFPG